MAQAKTKGIDPVLMRNILIIGGVAVGGFALYKVGQGLGFIDTDKEQKKQELLKQVVQSEADNAGATTIPKSNLALIAQTIYEQLRYSSWADDKDGAILQLKKMGNTADILNLIVAFGTRQNYWFGIPWGDKQTLPEFVNVNLDQDDINDINDNYKKKGINYQF